MAFINLSHLFSLLFGDLMKLAAIIVFYFAGQDLVQKDSESPKTSKQIIFHLLKAIGVFLVMALWLGNTGNTSGQIISDESVELFFLLAVPFIIGVVEKIKKQKFFKVTEEKENKDTDF